MDRKNKEGSNFFKSLKYVPKHLTSLSFFLLFGVISILFSGRKSESLRFNFLLDFMPDFYQHISNFSLSFLLYAGIGYLWLMMDVKIRYINAFGIVLLLANLVYELYIPVLNTPDIMDAYFGFVGTFFGFLFLVFVKRYGLKFNPLVK